MTSARPLFGHLALALLAACASAPVPEPSSTSASPLPAEPLAEVAMPVAAGPPPAPDKTAMRISIAAVGDMMLGTDYPQNHLPDDDGVSFLAEVAPVLAAADVAVGNHEGVLLDGGEPGKQCSNPDACYLFRSPTRYARYFREAGFDVLGLANNHARDFGEEGRSSSMAAIAAAGMYHTGRVDDFASFEVGDLKVAVLAYAVTRNSNLLLDYELAFATVADFARRHDIVIVTFHGGAEGANVTHIPFAEEEYYGEPRGDVVWFARGAVDAGADLVVGHGPHVVRGMERYKGRLIAYSLGNFATYYGISVAGMKGIAPIVTATLNGEGAFIEGDIVSTMQLRPGGPSIDPDNRALNLIRGLSIEDFAEPGLIFLADGRVLPAARPDVPAHELADGPP